MAPAAPVLAGVATERWLVARRRDVLPIPYFHVVFTLPHALNPLAQSHPRLIYRLLFRARPPPSCASGAILVTSGATWA